MSDLAIDPHMLNCARIRLSHLGHWHGDTAEVDISRIEYAISLSKEQAHSARWRKQTLSTALSSHVESKFLLNLSYNTCPVALYKMNVNI